MLYFARRNGRLTAKEGKRKAQRRAVPAGARGNRLVEFRLLGDTCEEMGRSPQTLPAAIGRSFVFDRAATNEREVRAPALVGGLLRLVCRSGHVLPAGAVSILHDDVPIRGDAQHGRTEGRDTEGHGRGEE